ncbi:MAG: calcium-binding protein [Oscillatoriales cyanobacterium RM1_1_9]|nr:calcium-binding protein [Oscillatoriales cyanobacterium RM1_1_9]
MTSVGPTRLTPGPDSYDQDLLAIAPKPDTILGLTGNDSILSSTLGGSQVEGNEDNDFLTSRGPNDTIFGGTGNDSLTARSTETRLIGDDGRGYSVFRLCSYSLWWSRHRLSARFFREQYSVW